MSGAEGPLRLPRRCALAGGLALAACLAGADRGAAAPTPEELAASVTPIVGPVEQLRTGSTVRPLASGSRRGRTAVPADVLFGFGRATVRRDGRRALVGLARSLTAGPVTLRVVGHTDGVGDAAANRRLSLRRARAVVAVLRPGLPGAVRIVAAGRGEEDPVADETTATGEDDPDGRARNRRVELRVTSP